MNLTPLLHRINQKETHSIIGLTSAARAYFAARLFGNLSKSLLILTPTVKEADTFTNNLNFFLGENFPILLFPNLDVLPYYQLTPHPDVLTQRLSVLYELFQGRNPQLIVTSIAAATRILPPKSIFNDYADYVVAGEEIDRESLLLKLNAAGYLSVPLVEDAGTYSIRGGILDVFPPHSEKPYRLEFFGDQVESMRLFDPATQRSLQAASELILLPAREIVLNENTIEQALTRLKPVFDEQGLTRSEREPLTQPLKNKIPIAGLETFLPFFYEKPATLLDYLKPDTAVLWIEPNSGREHFHKLFKELDNAKAHATSLERLVPVESLYSLSEFEKKIAPLSLLKVESLALDQDVRESSTPAFHFATETNQLLSTKVLPPSASAHMLEPLVEHLRSLLKQNLQIVLIASGKTQQYRLVDLFSRHDLKVQEILGSPAAFFTESKFSGGNLWVTVGNLSQGFSIEEDRFIFITDDEIFGRKSKKSRKPAPLSQVFTAFESLKENDYIVHHQHGVGIYRKLLPLDFGGTAGEFLLLEYQGGDKLYLPIYRLNAIQRYTHDENTIPTLDKLGSQQWAKVKEKVKKSIQAMAGELLKIYAARATQSKIPLLEGGEIFEEFEAAFPYEETADQETAIAQVLKDLESDKPMDRLLCGDVGYGKTEVALRAVFKAVLNGKQAAVLVPTTILAFQHHETFQKRLNAFGVKIDMLCRFRDAKEQKQIVEKLQKGELDVVIGTHRLLQSDLKFKNLALLVIDEEHRFGVTHKEKIKKFKNTVDVLTLTATPIPRTLNLSLFGIRDISVLNTPPADREAVRTYVAQFDEGLIREAVLRELQRGGQVFFVHNRVQTIYSMAERLQKLVPEAVISIAHGQMTEDELEESILQFLNKKSNLLLCTSIIESGIDFPSANTILINRADTFGLAQLYQLRGRVGRSNLKAYCYLLIPVEAAITADARSRLAVLQRFTELGSGFKIAAHDLEMRGAGNILGGEQHGHVSAIGYDMYLNLLEQTITSIKGEEQIVEVDPELNFKVPALIPESYIQDPSIRLGLYKRISLANEEDALDQLSLEFQDRFGEKPSAVDRLIDLMKVRLVAKRLLIESITQESARVIFKFHPQTKLPLEALLKRVKKDPKHYQLTPDGKWLCPLKETQPEKILGWVYRLLLELEGEIPSIL